MSTRCFVDERYPDEIITEDEIKKNYGEQVADGSIDPAEKGYWQYLDCCMAKEGGTLTEYIPESQPPKLNKYSFLIQEKFEDSFVIEAESLDKARSILQEQYDKNETRVDSFCGSEILIQCDRCHHEYDDVYDFHEISAGDTPKMTLCDKCLWEMVNCGELLACDFCGATFAEDRLKRNPKNNKRELCPECNSVYNMYKEEE